MLEEKVVEIKKIVLDMYSVAKTGHISSSFSCAEIMTALFYGKILRYDAKNPNWSERDRFILSKGHAGIIYYAILGDLGFFNKKELMEYAKPGSRMSVHVDREVPGVEVTTGSLACGLGISVGMAKAAKMNLDNHLVFCLVGDGECYEGAIWESAAFASHNNLNNLVVIVDHNHMCCSGFIEDSLNIEPLNLKWEAFGFDTVTIDGHDISIIIKTLSRIRTRKSQKPLCIIADTVKANGLKNVENTPLCHGFAPKTEEQIKKLYEEINGEK